MKIYRKLEAGINPDLEVTRFLVEKAGFRSVPALALVAGQDVRADRRVRVAEVGRRVDVVDRRGDVESIVHLLRRVSS